MGRAGWGILFMTLISLAVAVAGLYDGNSVDNVISENPTLDKFFSTNGNYTVSRSDDFDNTIYTYLDDTSSGVSQSTEDYYSGSWSFTKTVLNFFKDFFVPASVLGSIAGFEEWPNTIVLWVINILWNIIYALLIFEVVWRFNVFD